MFGMLLQKIKKILSLNAVCIPYYNFISQKNCHDKFNYIYFSPKKYTCWTECGRNDTTSMIVQ